MLSFYNTEIKQYIACSNRKPFHLRVSFQYFYFNIQSMKQIITIINYTIWRHRDAVGELVSCRVPTSLLLVCLYELQNLTKGWKHRREIFFFFFFPFCTLWNSREWKLTALKSVSSRNDDLCKGQVEVEDISPPRGVFQREANTNMVARRFRCCVMAVSDSDTYWLSRFWIPVGRLPFAAADIFRAF